jgi:hypothetical protein
MTAKAAGLALPPEYNWIFGYEYSGYVLAGWGRYRGAFVNYRLALSAFDVNQCRFLENFVRIRLYRKQAAEFDWLADTASLASAQRRYRIIARHYGELADREEQADKARMAERLRELRLKRQDAAPKTDADLRADLQKGATSAQRAEPGSLFPDQLPGARADLEKLR